MIKIVIPKKKKKKKTLPEKIFFPKISTLSI